MHEFSVAEALLAQVLEVAGQNGMARIRAVELDVGALECIHPEALDLAFEAVTRGTPAKGAKLIQREIPGRAECGACGEHYDLVVDRYACPLCGAAEAKITAGREILLRTVTGDEETPTATGDGRIAADPGINRPSGRGGAT